MTDFIDLIIKCHGNLDYFLDNVLGLESKALGARLELQTQLIVTNGNIPPDILVGYLWWKLLFATHDNHVMIVSKTVNDSHIINRIARDQLKVLQEKLAVDESVECNKHVIHLGRTTMRFGSAQDGHLGRGLRLNCIAVLDYDDLYPSVRSTLMSNIMPCLFPDATDGLRQLILVGNEAYSDQHKIHW